MTRGCVHRLVSSACIAVLLVTGMACGRSADGPDEPDRPDPPNAPVAPAAPAPPAPLKAAATSWPSFRGGPALRGVATSTLPLKPELLWTYEADDAVGSTAAIVGGVVYVGVYDDRLLAIDLAKGERLWEYEANGSVESAPCVSGGVVYFGDGEALFHAVDARTGKRLWTHQTQGEIISSAITGPGGRGGGEGGEGKGGGGSSVLFGSYDSRLYCLGTEEGKLRWDFGTGAQVHCSPCLVTLPAVNDKKPVTAAAIAGCDGVLRLVDIADGEEVSAVNIGGNISASPASDGKRIYFGTLDGRMIATDAAATKILWEIKPGAEGGEDELEGAGSFFASAAVDSGFVVFAGRDRKLHCVRAEDGKLLWTYEAKGGIDSSPVIVKRPRRGKGPRAGEARVIFGCKAGRIYSVGLDDGKLKWSFETGSEVTASPAVGEGRMVIGDADGAVRCFGEKK